VDWIDKLKEVERLRWRLLRPVANLLVGPYRSVFRGEGIEFSDARPYQPGDDWRRVHWSLTARKNQPYLRLGQEERELTCVIAIDRSASMRISPEKEQLTLEAIVALALSAWLNGDRVRWVTFTDSVEGFSAARRGERHIWGSLAQLITTPPRSRHTRLAPLLGWLASVHRRRVFFVLISDLFFHDEGAWSLLRALTVRHFVLLVVPRVGEEALHLPWGLLPVEEVEIGWRETVRSLQPPLHSGASFRQAVLFPQLSPIQALRKALLPPLY
jgi:uncharacterized protein (DUF58 family)